MNCDKATVVRAIAERSKDGPLSASDRGGLLIAADLLDGYMRHNCEQYVKVRDLETQVQQLKEMMGVAYQVAGVAGAQVEVLDAFFEASDSGTVEGDPLDLLPVKLDPLQLTLTDMEIDGLIQEVPIDPNHGAYEKSTYFFTMVELRDLLQRVLTLTR